MISALQEAWHGIFELAVQLGSWNLIIAGLFVTMLVVTKRRRSKPSRSVRWF